LLSRHVRSTKSCYRLLAFLSLQNDIYFTFPFVSLFYPRTSFLLTRVKWLESSRNCKLHASISDLRNCIRRYSNTLFLTLNNRIYFRDHPPPAISGDSAYLSSTGRPPASPLRFSQTIPSQSMTTSHTSVEHGTILPTLAEDPEKVISDVVTIVSEPRYVSHPQYSRCSKTSHPWQVGQRY
jgi:hypothetical protein